MPTTKKRINISITDEMDEILQALAERDQVPQATKAEQLIRLAIEVEEDEMLNAIALERDVPGAKFLSHKEVWG